MREVCRGQIAIALYHSRRRTASARSVVEKCHFSSTAKGREWESLPAPIATDPLCASPAVQYNPPRLHWEAEDSSIYSE